jgi:hypothetical protein
METGALPSELRWAGSHSIQRPFSLGKAWESGWNKQNIDLHWKEWTRESGILPAWSEPLCRMEEAGEVEQFPLLLMPPSTPGLIDLSPILQQTTYGSEAALGPKQAAAG